MVRNFNEEPEHAAVRPDSDTPANSAICRYHYLDEDDESPGPDAVLIILVGFGTGAGSPPFSVLDSGWLMDSDSTPSLSIC